MPSQMYVTLLLIVCTHRCYRPDEQEDAGSPFAADTTEQAVNSSDGGHHEGSPEAMPPASTANMSFAGDCCFCQLKSCGRAAAVMLRLVCVPRRDAVVEAAAHHTLVAHS